MKESWARTCGVQEQEKEEETAHKHSEEHDLKPQAKPQTAGVTDS